MFIADHVWAKWVGSIAATGIIVISGESLTLACRTCQKLISKFGWSRGPRSVHAPHDPFVLQLVGPRLIYCADFVQYFVVCYLSPSQRYLKEPLASVLNP